MNLDSQPLMKLASRISNIYEPSFIRVSGVGGLLRSTTAAGMGFENLIAVLPLSVVPPGLRDAGSSESVNLSDSFFGFHARQQNANAFSQTNLKTVDKNQTEPYHRPRIRGNVVRRRKKIKNV
jgi:hypothetical protein